MRADIVTMNRADYDRMVQELNGLKANSEIYILQEQRGVGKSTGEIVIFKESRVPLSKYRKSRMNRIREMSCWLQARESRLAELKKEINTLESKYGWLLKLLRIRKE